MDFGTCSYKILLLVQYFQAIIDINDAEQVFPGFLNNKRRKDE